LFGEEQFLVKWAAKTIAEKHAPQEMAELSRKRLYGSETDADEIISCCETLPLLAERKTVTVEGIAAFGSSGDKAPAGFGEERFAAYLSDVPPHCMLIMTADNVDKRKKIYKTVAENGSVYEFTKLDRGLLATFIEKRLKAAKAKASRAVLNEFIAMTGYLDKGSACTLFNIENEISKLVAHCNGEIRPDDIYAVMPANASLNIFALSDAVSKGDGGEALRLLNTLLSSGTGEFAILGLLFSQFDLMLSAREMMDEGKTRAEMQRLLGVNEYRLKIAAGHAARFSAGGLRDIIGYACEADRNIKTGVLRPELAMEVFILRATGKPFTTGARPPRRPAGAGTSASAPMSTTASGGGREGGYAAEAAPAGTAPTGRESAPGGDRENGCAAEAAPTPTSAAAPGAGREGIHGGMA
jgi:DNA polymerase-3 subunit delta